MPRRLRRPKARSTVTPGMLLQLRCGHDFFGDGFGGAMVTDQDGKYRKRDLDDGLMERVWREHKDAVLEAARRRYGAGHRPWAWWLFDAPEPRNESEDETAQLDRLGVLTDEERAELQLPEAIQK